MASGSRVARALQAEYPPSSSDALELLKLLSMVASGVGNQEKVFDSLAAGARVAEEGPAHKGVTWKVPFRGMRKSALGAVAPLVVVLHVARRALEITGLRT